MQNLLVLNGAHEPDGLTNALTDAYVAEASQVANVVRLDLRELHFDYLLRRAHLQQPQEPDLIRASQAILAAKHVTWLFPMWWSGTPTLVKAFVDRVLVSGFAFRYRGRYEAGEGLLQGRSARLVSSMDCPGFWYQFVQGRPLHRSFVNGTLKFCGFSPVRSTMVFDARFMDDRAREKALERVVSAARADALSLRKGTVLAALPSEDV